MSAWCIPCPDHIIVEHNQVAPLGPKPGFCRFHGLGVGISLLRNDETWEKLMEKWTRDQSMSPLFPPRNVLQEHDNFIVPWC